MDFQITRARNFILGDFTLWMLGALYCDDHPEAYDYGRCHAGRPLPCSDCAETPTPKQAAKAPRRHRRASRSLRFRRGRGK